MITCSQKRNLHSIDDLKKKSVKVSCIIENIQHSDEKWSELEIFDSDDTTPTASISTNRTQVLYMKTDYGDLLTSTMSHDHDSGVMKSMLPYLEYECTSRTHGSALYRLSTLDDNK